MDGWKSGAERRSPRLWARRLTAIAGLAVFASAPECAGAQTADHASSARSTSAIALDIPAQPLDSALNTFGRITGIQIIYDSGITAAVRSASVRGTMLPSEALGRMLAPTGLLPRFTGPRTATLQRRSDLQSSAQAAAGDIESTPSNNQSAQAPIFELGTILDTIVVETHRTPETEKAATTQRITAEDIQRRGARNLSEALMLAEGLNIRFGADGTQRIDIRGFRTRQVKLLLNGVPLNSSVDGQFDPSRLSAESIAYIQVTRGPSSVLYGPGANAGIINIVTKGAAPGLHGSASFEAGEGKSRLGQGFVSYGGERVKVQLGGSVYDRDYFPLSGDFVPTSIQPAGKRLASDRKDGNLNGTASYTLSETTTIGVTANYASGSFGKPPSIVDRVTHSDPFAGRARYERVDDYETSTFQVVGSHESSGWSLRPRLYMNRESELTNRYDNTNYNSQRTNNSFREDTTSLISGAEMLATYTSKAGSTSFSAGAEQQKWEGQTITRPDHNSPIFASVDASAKILRAAVEHEVRPLERLGLVAGIGVAQQDRSSARDTDYTYRLATTYDLTPATLIRLQHARQLRFPSLRDLYRTDGGNPDLKTEQTMHYELGIEQQLSFFDSRIGAAIFQIDAENFITRNNTTNLLDNLDQSRTRGFELFASAKPVPDFFVRTGYTYLDARNLSQGAAVDTIQHVPEHKVTLDTSYRFTTGLTATLSCMRVMNNYTTNDTNTAFKNVGDYSIVNVGLSQEVLGGKGALFARVHNLFDANYQDSYGFNQAGRTFFAGARVNF